MLIARGFSVRSRRNGKHVDHAEPVPVRGPSQTHVEHFHDVHEQRLVVGARIGLLGDESIEVRGRVLDPDGKPVAGAKLYLAKYTPNG